MIRRPALILAILTGLNLLNYMDRTVLAAVLARVQDKSELDLDDAQGGTLATAFLIGYFVTSPIFGALADRGGRKGLMAFGVLVWSVATYATGHTHSYWTMLLARAVVGVGEASYASVAPTIIDDLAPKEKKGRWLSVFYLAIPLGSAIGYLVGGFIEKRFDWRTAFYVAGGPGIVLALACLLIVEPERKLAAKKESPLKMLRPLFKQPLYLRAVLGYCFSTFALGGFAFWAPKFIVAEYDMRLDRANYVFGLVLIVAGVLTTGIGGYLGDRAARKRTALGQGENSTPLGHLRVCAIASFLGAPCAAAAFLSPTALLFFVFMFLAIACVFLGNSPINAALLSSVPTHLRASAMAMSIFAIHILGDMWSPPLVGVLMKGLGSRPLAMQILPIAIALAGVAWFVRKTPAKGTPTMEKAEASEP
ncbi:MFS transporter [soil metagenome]